MGTSGWRHGVARILKKRKKGRKTQGKLAQAEVRPRVSRLRGADNWDCLALGPHATNALPAKANYAGFRPPCKIRSPDRSN
jgi:hypothetical protein